jgi:hypothetical protein
VACPDGCHTEEIVVRHLLIVLCLLLGSGTAVRAQMSVGIGIGMPGVNIGINLPAYPQLVRVPNYPVYYAPGVQGNFFFYDGLYWVFENDNWYASSWYNGPWSAVAPEVVPVYVLRVPVRYYRSPPVYFRGWRPDAPPRWGEHWGNSWEQNHRGWDRRNRAVPPPAPLPNYQRKFPNERYPQPAQQPSLHGQNYRYVPREPAVRQHYQEQIRPAPPQGRQPDRKPGQGHGQDRDKDDKRGRDK